MGRIGRRRNNADDDPPNIDGPIARWHACSAVLGGFLVHLTLGTVFSFGNLTSYMTSYVKARVDPNYTYEAASWIYTGNMVARGIFTAIGGYLEWKIGTRITVLLGCALATAGVWTTAVSIKSSSWLLVLTQGALFGAGIGVAYVGPLTCGMKWFPNRKGLVSGIVVGGFGLGSFMVVPIQTAFLNPDNVSVEKTTGFFTDDKVLDRVPLVFHVLGGLYAALQIIGCILLRNPPDPAEKHGLLDRGSRPGSERQTGQLATATTTRLPPSDSRLPSVIYNRAFEENADEVEESAEPEDPSLSPREMLRRKEFYMLWFTFFFNQQAIGYATVMYKPYGQTFIDDDRFLSILGSVASIFNTLGRVLWGALADRTSYRTAMLALTFLTAALYASLETTPYGGKAMYGAWILAIYFAFSGTFALMPPATSQTFGPTYAGPNYGLVFTNGVLASIAQSVVLEHLTGIIGSLGILLVTAGCAACSFVINVFYDKNPSPAKIRSSLRRSST